MHPCAVQDLGFGVGRGEDRILGQLKSGEDGIRL